ncbi:MAG: metalloregulator ArsR/SmtB family transcription factor [Pseudomonadota bacterium]
MNHDQQAQALTALGHPARLAVFRLLARRTPDGVRPSEIADALGLKANTLSVHVTTLLRAGLVTSERAGRSVLYRIDLDQAGALVDFLVGDCCRGRPELCRGLGPKAPAERGRVLFLCTHNSARSIFGEAILADRGGESFIALSAGTRPRAKPNAYALQVLEGRGHDVSALRSKDIAEFQGADAVPLDYVFTVCDDAANTDCPAWPGRPLSAHWGLPDPTLVRADPDLTRVAFESIYDRMAARIDAFLALPKLDPVALQARLDAIGQMERSAP